MELQISLSFNGNCIESIKFYTKVFNIAMPEITTYGSFSSEPDWELPEDAKNLIMYANINVFGINLMFSDNLDGLEGNCNKNIGLVIVGENADEIRRLYNSLKENGTVNDELGKTGWSELYGLVTDKFGIQWQLMLG